MGKARRCTYHLMNSISDRVQETCCCVCLCNFGRQIIMQRENDRWEETERCRENRNSRFVVTGCSVGSCAIVFPKTCTTSMETSSNQNPKYQINTVASPLNKIPPILHLILIVETTLSLLFGGTRELTFTHGNNTMSQHIRCESERIGKYFLAALDELTVSV